MNGGIFLAIKVSVEVDVMRCIPGHGHGLEIFSCKVPSRIPDPSPAKSN